MQMSEVWHVVCGLWAWLASHYITLWRSQGRFLPACMPQILNLKFQIKWQQSQLRMATNNQLPTARCLAPDVLATRWPRVHWSISPESVSECCIPHARLGGSRCSGQD